MTKSLLFTMGGNASDAVATFLLGQNTAANFLINAANISGVVCHVGATAKACEAVGGVT